MIRRKLTEANNNTLRKLNEAFERNAGFTDKELNKLYNTLFEDVDSARYVFIHNIYNEDCDDLLGMELFEEVKFGDGSTHYFISECYNGKTEVTEVRPSEMMLEHKEYC